MRDGRNAFPLTVRRSSDNFDESWGQVPDARFYFGRPGDAWQVYILESEYGVKVGICGLLALEARLGAISAAAGLPVELVRSYVFADKPQAFQAEQEAHRRLSPTRKRGEWFHCHPFEATSVLDRLYADARQKAAA